MMSNQLKDAVQNELKNHNVGELSPGATGRRYEPVEGTSNLNKRIHKESAYADKYKNLPFSFSKPKKAPKSEVKICNNCDAYVSVTKNTVGVICSSCKTYSSVREVPLDGREEEKQ